MKKKKNKIILIIAVVLLIGSASLFIYPEISKSIVKSEAKHTAESFDKRVNEIIESDDQSEKTAGAKNHKEAVDQGIINEDGYLIDKVSGTVISEYPIVFRTDLNRLYKDSASYNNQLKKRQDMNIDFSYAALNLENYGIYDDVYRYITIASLDLTLPIYLGSTEYNMAIGVTHLMNTSLPIGGSGTNTVIAGHTGYIGRTFFDALPYLDPGDEVYVTNFWETMTYRVITSKVIGATETNDLYIQKDRDLLTLLTCSNAGKKRYQVQCERK